LPKLDKFCIFNSGSSIEPILATPSRINLQNITAAEEGLGAIIIMQAFHRFGPLAGRSRTAFGPERYVEVEGEKRLQGMKSELAGVRMEQFCQLS
jgi:hypothetical protein